MIRKIRWGFGLVGLGLTLTVFQNCGLFSKPTHFSAQSSSSLAGTLTCASPDSVQGQALYTTNCAGCHGDFSNSLKSGRTFTDIKGAIGSVPAMASLSGLSDTDVQAIAAALDLGPNATVACATSDPGSSSTAGGIANVAASATNFFACNPADDPGVRDLRRLTKSEYLKTLTMLTQGYFDVTTLNLQTDLLPADAISTGSPVFDTADNTISANHTNAYLTVANTLGPVLANNPSFLNDQIGCTSSGGMTDACWAKYFSGFAARAFRRPLTASEQTLYKTLFADPTLAGSFTDGMSVVLASTLSSPNFIFKHEMDGTPINGRTDLLQLNDYELASRLSFWVLGRGPDTQLMTDAAAGTLKTSAGFQSVVNRLYQSPEAQSLGDDFYSQWLGVNNMPGPNQTTSFAGQVPLTMVQAEAAQEILDFTEYFTWKAPGTYKDLMSSTKNFTRGPALSAIYGVSASAGAGGSQTFTGQTMTATVGRADGTSGWNLYSNGNLSQAVTLAVGTVTQVNVSAKADLALNVGAAMTVSFDSQMIGQTTVSATSYQNYTFSFTPNHASGRITVAFTNDVYDANTNSDRNLYVQTVALAPQTVATASTELPSTQRAGLMTRTALLLGATDRTGLVHRGLLGRRNVLCDPISPPIIPAGQAATFAPPVPDPVLSQRQQIEQRTSLTQCQACHSMLNPMGFSLENYDSLGRFRLAEGIFDSSGNMIASHPINAVVEPNIEHNTEPNVNNGVEMSTAIASSAKGPACLVKQYFIYTQKRVWTAADGCALNAVYSQLTDAKMSSASGDSPATILNMFKSTVYERSFSVRKIGPQ